MTARSSRGRKRYVTLAILLLVIVVLTGGVVFLLSNWRSSGPWRLDDAWGGQNLNHPGPVGTKMLSGAVSYRARQHLCPYWSRMVQVLSAPSII